MSEGGGLERDCGWRCAWGPVLAVGTFGCCGACLGESDRRFGGHVGRGRMACGRSECGRRSARRVTQTVGVMQHSASCGTLGRQELVGKVVVWGREAGGCRVLVCIGPVASRRAIYVSAVRPDVRAVDARLGWARGRLRLTDRLAARLCCVCPSRKCV